MNYLRPHNRTRTRNLRIGAAIITVAAAVFFLFAWKLPYFLPELATSIARPFWRVTFSLESGSLNSPDALLAENERLKLQLVANQVNASSTDAIMAQNTELLSLLGRPEAALAFDATSSPFTLSPSPFTLSAVLERPPIAPFDELLIDIGDDHHVLSNDDVYAPGNILIGQVREVFGRTSRVVLLSSPGQTYNVLVGNNNIPALAVGKGGGEYQAELPRDIAISVGDPVFAPSINSRPLGVVSGVVSNPTDPFEAVLFSAPLNIFQLRWVLVDTASSTEKVEKSKS